MNWLMNLINWLARTLGRFLFAIPFLLFGVMHFMFGGQMADMVPLPLGIIWVYVTGAALIAASVSIMIGKKDKLAAGLLGIMLVMFALLVHVPGMAEAGAMLEATTEGSDAAQLAQERVNNFTSNILKDLALAGAAFMYAGSVGARDK